MLTHSGHSPACDAGENRFEAPIIVSPPVEESTEPSRIANADTAAASSVCDESIAAVPKSEVWGIPFDCVTLDETVHRIQGLVKRRRPSYVITANLNYVMLHHRRVALRDVTRDAALIIADGQPIIWQSRLCSRPLPERVAGSDLIFRLAETAAEQGWRIYFLGGAAGVAERCAQRLSQRYPGLSIAGIESPPFRELTAEETEAQRVRIRESGADLLLVAFGQPKGEQWIHQHYQQLGIPVSIQLGASFDFIAGTAVRAPRIWQRCGLEWAYRMARDPKRLVPRYLANATFLARMIGGAAAKVIIRAFPSRVEYR